MPSNLLTKTNLINIQTNTHIIQTNAYIFVATIINTQTDEHIDVEYNPEEVKLEQGNNFAEVGIPGLNSAPVQYVRGKARSLSMELFFDAYEEEVQDVRKYTSPIVRLLDKTTLTEAPPVLLFVMGQITFQCVLVEANQRFTMFTRAGIPVRSTLAVRFHEFVRVEFEIKQGFFAGPPALHTIKQGETLSSLAGVHLGDPRDWRAIAEANNIDDPFNIPSGRPLVIPGKGNR